MDIQAIISKLHPLERTVVPLLKDTMSFESLLHESKLSDIELTRATQWLENKSILKIQTKEEQLIVLDDNGLKYKETGLPEMLFLKALSTLGLATLNDIIIKSAIGKEEANICIGTLKSKAAIIFDQDRKLSITEQGKKILGKVSLEEEFLKKEFPINVASLQPEEKFAFDNLIKRKNILRLDTKKFKTLTLTDIGRQVVSSGIKSQDYLDSLTPDMLKTGSWKNKKFRHYDIQINVPRTYGSKRHFVEIGRASCRERV